MSTWDSVTDKRIKTLHESIQDDVTSFINLCKLRGYDIRVTQAMRTKYEQDALYAIGRRFSDGVVISIDSSKKVTNVPGTFSYHNYGLAFDICEIKKGKAFWDIDYNTIVPIAKDLGFEWGGDFKNWQDKPHFQKTYGYTCSQLQNGAINTI